MPRAVWEAVVEEDQADAALEAYKWALRAGETEGEAVAAADRAGRQVLKLHRKARRKDFTDEVRNEALATLSAGYVARRAGQLAAAKMLAAHATASPPRHRNPKDGSACGEG